MRRILMAGILCYSWAATAADWPAVMLPVREIHEAQTRPLMDAIKQRVDAGDTQILLQIHSSGGSVADGMDLLLALTEYRKAGIEILCVVDAKAFSMGAVLLEAGCSKRYMTKRATVLFHNSRVTPDSGTATSLEREAVFLRVTDLTLSEMVSSRLGISLEDYQAKLAGGDWMMAWKEAVAEGVVDDTVDPLELPPLMVLTPKSSLEQLLLGL